MDPTEKILREAFQRLFNETELRAVIKDRMISRPNFTIDDVVTCCRIVGYHMFKKGIAYAKPKQPIKTKLERIEDRPDEVDQSGGQQNGV